MDCSSSLYDSVAETVVALLNPSLFARDDASTRLDSVPMLTQDDVDGRSGLVEDIDAGEFFALEHGEAGPAAGAHV